MPAQNIHAETLWPDVDPRIRLFLENVGNETLLDLALSWARAGYLGVIAVSDGTPVGLVLAYGKSQHPDRKRCALHIGTIIAAAYPSREDVLLHMLSHLKETVQAVPDFPFNVLRYDIPCDDAIARNVAREIGFIVTDQRMPRVFMLSTRRNVRLVPVHHSTASERAILGKRHCTGTTPFRGVLDLIAEGNRRRALWSTKTPSRT